MHSSPTMLPLCVAFHAHRALAALAAFQRRRRAEAVVAAMRSRLHRAMRHLTSRRKACVPSAVVQVGPG